MWRIKSLTYLINLIVMAVGITAIFFDKKGTELVVLGLTNILLREKTQRKLNEFNNSIDNFRAGNF